MSFLRAKIALFVFFLVFIVFFSNDFGLIDIEKTAIITALAIDYENEEYTVSAQVAVPEATSVNTENKKALVTGKGNTVGSAIKNIADISGWYPKMEFCNIVIVGKELANDNVIKVLDYFSKSLRIQDSAVLVMSDTKAKDILDVSTPLDNISSFALQKVLLKSPGFDRDVVETDVKTFAIDYYGKSASSTMPIVKIVKQDDKTGDSVGSGGESGGGGSSEKYLFNAKNTALFVSGKMVGQLDENQTLAYNMLYKNFYGTTLELSVKNPLVTRNYLLTVLKCDKAVSLSATESDLDLTVKLNLYCKISDQDATRSDSTFEKNVPLPLEVKEEAKQMIYSWVQNLIKQEKDTGCDLFRIKEKLYRFNYKQYSRYKDDYIEKFKANVTVNVDGQQ